MARSRGRGCGLEEPLRGGIHRNDVIVVVHHDDRVRHVAKHEIEAVPLDANLFLGALQPLPATRELFADVPDIGDVLEHGDRAAHADPIVRDRRRDDLVDQLVALDGVH